MPKPASKVVIHDGFFVPVCPKRAVVCIAGDPERNRVAVLRLSGAVEIYFAGDSPHLIRSLEPDYTREELRPRRKPADDAEESSAEGSQASPYWATAITFAADGRLFAIGAHGFVFEILLDRFYCAGKVAHAGLGSPTTIAGHGRQLAVGTDNGFVVSFCIDADGPGSGPCFDRKLPRVHESPVTALSWSPDGKQVAVSTKNAAVAVIDVTTGGINSVCPVSFSKSIGAVLFLGDGTVVTGDTQGTISFWDAKTASMIHAFTASMGEILTITKPINDDSKIFFGGNDPLVHTFQRGDKEDESVPPVKTKRRETQEPNPVMLFCYTPATWVESRVLRVHTKKVTGLAHVGPWLISGSVDGLIYFTQRKAAMCFPPVLDASRFQVVQRARHLMVSHRDRIVFYRLQKPKVEEDTPAESLSMDVLLGLEEIWLERPRRAELPDADESHGTVFLPGKEWQALTQPKPTLVVEPSATKVGASIVSGAALADGSVIVYSLSGELRFLAWYESVETYRIEPKPVKRLQVTKNEDVPILPSQKLLPFLYGFLSVTTSGSLQVFDCSNREAPVAEPVFKIRKKSKRKSAAQEDSSDNSSSSLNEESSICVAAAVSSDGSMAAISFCDNSLIIVDPRIRKVLCRVPKLNVPITSMTINGKNHDLIVAFANRTVVEYNGKVFIDEDYRERGIASAMTEWSRHWVPPEWWKKEIHSVKSIIPRGRTHLILADARKACVVDKAKSVHEETSARAVVCFTASKYLACFARVSGEEGAEEFLCVYQTVDDFTKGIPDPPQKKKFGQK